MWDRITERGQIKRCRKTLLLCILEGLITLVAVIALLLFFGRTLLSIFNSDPEVVSVGYVRLLTIMTAHVFSLLYEVMSGYLRGFGISLVPAVLTIIGVCGIRILWIQFVFPHSRTFQDDHECLSHQSFGHDGDDFCRGDVLYL